MDNFNRRSMLESVRLPEFDINRYKTSKGASFFLCSSYSKQPGLFKEVLNRHDVDVNAKSCWNSTALHYIAGHQEPKIGIESAKLLIKKGATVDARDKEGRTPLHIAAQKGKAGIFELLLNHILDESSTLPNGDSILHTAVSSRAPGGVRCTKLILLKWPHLLEQPNREGFTPLHSCVYAQNARCLEALINSGASIRALDPNGRDALLCHAASYDRGTNRIVGILFREGASVDSRDPHGRGPLHLACKHHDVSDYNGTLIREIIEEGADIEAEDQVTYGKQEVIALWTCV